MTGKGAGSVGSTLAGLGRMGRVRNGQRAVAGADHQGRAVRSRVDHEALRDEHLEEQGERG
jgi:hypothetical protein